MPKDYRESKRKYSKKRYEKEKTLKELYRGSARSDEDFNTFSKRVLRKLI